MTSLCDLPLELIQHIVSYLPDKDAHSAVCASPYITIPKNEWRRRRWLRHSIQQLAVNGDLEGIKYLHSVYKNNMFGLNQDVISMALELASIHGYVEIVQYLLDNTEKEHLVHCSILGWHEALWNSHLPIISLLHRVCGHTEVPITTLGAICDNGILAVVQYLYENKLVTVGRNGNYAMDRASWKGNLPIVQYLHSVGEKPSKDAIDSAAFEGHLAIVQFLHGIGASMTTEAIEGACFSGHYDIVRFLHTVGAPFTGDAIRIAREKGYYTIAALLGVK